MARKTRKPRVGASGDKAKGDMRSPRNNRWLVAIIGGAIADLLVVVVRFYLFEYGAKKAVKPALIARLNNADEFLEKDMIDDALATYYDMLKTVSPRQYPEIYAHIKNNEGTCYLKSASVRDKEENLIRAIRAYREALKIFTVEKYPVYCAKTLTNLGNAYTDLADVRDKEENLTKAITAFEEAVEICTVENYSLYYDVIMSNMRRAKQKMKNEH